MQPVFHTDYDFITSLVDKIDPVRYGKTRNYIDGGVCYISPYISRGVINTKMVLETVLNKGYKIAQIESFVKELCWRDYFQRVMQVRDVDCDIKQAQYPVSNHGVPLAILNAETGIKGIDSAIKGLYETGYMHNHCRMFTAALVCNIAQSHWYNPAQWMYYHLLDGDWASNALSWQWVAGANSSKKYYANQEVINRYTHTSQTGTYVDTPYDGFENMEVPIELKDVEKFYSPTLLPKKEAIDIDPSLPTLVYNYYNMDPLWQHSERANRVLLIEPEFFERYPISERCMEFFLELGRNIEGIQVYVGSFESLKRAYDIKEIHFKEHPINIGYVGFEEQRDWIVEDVKGYYPSFFSYWKQVEKRIYMMNK